AISPSLWWNEARLSSELSAAPLTGQRVFMASGEWEATLSPWQQRQPQAPTMRERRARRALPERCSRLATQLVQRPGSGEVVYQQFPDEDHASVIMVATARALRFASAPLLSTQPSG